MQLLQIAFLFALAGPALSRPSGVFLDTDSVHHHHSGGGNNGGGSSTSSSSSNPSTSNSPSSSSSAGSSSSSSSTSSGSGNIPVSAIPSFGVTPGVKSSSQPGSCVGANNKNIPCTCPPTASNFASTLSVFAARGKAGDTPISFSTDFSDQSVGTNLARIDAMISTMQNLNFDSTGKAGDGCPAVSAPGLTDIQKQLLEGQDVKIGG